MTTTPTETTTETTTEIPTDEFTEVPVHAGILRANADLLDLFQEFFTDADHAVRAQLGRYLIARHNEEDTTDAGTEAAILIGQLTEAADLMHTLAGQDSPQHDHDDEHEERAW